MLVIWLALRVGDIDLFYSLRMLVLMPNFDVNSLKYLFVIQGINF